MALRKDFKEGKFKRKKKPKAKKGKGLINTTRLEEREETLPGMTIPLNKNPKFVQRPGEPDWLFLKRISKATQVIDDKKIMFKNYLVNSNFFQYAFIFKN